MDALYVAGVLGLIGVALWAATRQNEVFRIVIRGGRATVLRGKVAPSFLGDLRDIVRHVEEGSVHAVKRDGEPVLVVSASIDERAAQRLRNAFALTTAKRL
ncbi:MAG: hypothetical protein JWP97_4633 [Labilithrix sp.]|nr:hypothetical protein [Labilithrix sp.]